MTRPRRLSAKRECQILDVLDNDGAMPKAELAQQVGLSVHQTGEYLAALRDAEVVDYEYGSQAWSLRDIEREAE